MLLNGQGRGSSGLKNIYIKAEAEVREQSALNMVESVLLCFDLMFSSYCSLTFHILLLSLLLGSNFSHESAGWEEIAAQWSGSGQQWIEQQSNQGRG